MATIVRIKFGSHLYGTSTPESDTDYKSVHIPTARDILLQRAEAVRGTKVKVHEGQRNTADDVDDESYALHRYLQLLSEGQTVAIDMLFAPDWAIDGATAGVNLLWWRRIQANKNLLLTKKSAAFVGYCRQQANKYGIKGSRVAAAKKAMEFFAECSKDCGGLTRLQDVRVSLYKALIDEADEHTAIVQGGTVERPETFFECCNRKVSLGNTVKAAYEIYKRIYEEYGDRARRAESNEGIDWKALSHAVRVGWEALELLNTGAITFPLPHAPRILAIKQGRMPYDSVASEIEQLLEEVEKASLVSKLRNTADQAFIEELIVDAYGDEVQKLYYTGVTR